MVVLDIRARDSHGRIFNIEMHIFELPKFRPSSDNISKLSSEEKWLYLFRHAAEQETDLLQRC
jgi:hypothetical protein